MPPKNQDTGPGVTVWFPDALRPTVRIPYAIAREWMRYGRIGWVDHNAEWGCAVRLNRQEDGSIDVVDWEPYKIDASAGYWESIEGERQRHYDDLIAAGKEDEGPEWNGLFHTHPIGSGASMSGLDQTQLEEMALHHWAVSIISPGNREGVVHPEKFLAHYGHHIPGMGVFSVGNLKPTIVGAEVDTELEEIREKMKVLMVKKTKTIVPSKTTPGGPYGGINRRYNPITKMMEDSYQGINPLMYEKGLRDEPNPGDWVYIEKCETELYALGSLDERQKKEVEGLDGKVGLVTADTVMGHIDVNFSHYGYEDSWILDPKLRGGSDYGDDVLVIARAGSSEDALIRNGITAGVDPEQSGAVRQVIRRAGLEPPPYESVSDTTKSRKKAVK